jgi:hypothetical protein
MGTYIYRIIGAAANARQPVEVNLELLRQLTDAEYLLPPFTVVSGADVVNIEGWVMQAGERTQRQWDFELDELGTVPLDYTVHYYGELAAEALAAYASNEQDAPLAFMADRLALTVAGIVGDDEPYLYFPRVVSSSAPRQETIEVYDEHLASIQTVAELEEAQRVNPTILDPDYQVTPPLYDYLVVDPDKDLNVTYRHLVRSNLGNLLRTYWGELGGGEHYT